MWNSICDQKEQSFLSVVNDYEFLLAPLIFTLLSFFTRMWRIGLSNIVTWDEAQYVACIILAEENPIPGVESV